jgi:hypothetical protein
LIIRKEQLSALEEIRLPDFEHYMVEHLKEFSPLHSESLGEPGIRKLINVGVERAKRHRFTHRGPVKFYIETMILLGVDFDTDPQYPAAGALLRDPSSTDQTQRADRVHAWLMELLEAAAGLDRSYAAQALHRARAMPFQSISRSSPGFEDVMLKRMVENHPEKANYLGAPALRGLIPRAIEEAEKHGVATDAGVCLFVALMFAVGHGFARDPKYPWIAGTLTNPAITDPEKRVERLYSKTMTYLDHVLQHIEAR